MSNTGHDKNTNKNKNHSFEEFMEIYNQLNDENQIKVDQMIMKQYSEQIQNEDKNDSETN